jgi:hypothetical protein
MALDYLAHEFGKVFPAISREQLNKPLRDRVPDKDSNDMRIRDFWNLFCAMSSTWRLKDPYYEATARNTCWRKDRISIEYLIPQTPQGWMGTVGEYDFSKAIA